MSYKSLGNPYDENSRLTHSSSCACDQCVSNRLAPSKELQEMAAESAKERGMPVITKQTEVKAALPDDKTSLDSEEDIMDRAIENALVRGIFNHNDVTRRNFMRMVGGVPLRPRLGAFCL